MTMLLQVYLAGLTTFWAAQAVGCKDGKYGWLCLETCGLCASFLTCDQMTGRCPHGCAAGWRGEMCQTKCPEGKYGDNCRLSCGQCKDTGGCDTETGRCVKGGSPGWQGDLCDQMNMALNKTTRQSSIQNAFTSKSAAVDGRIPGGNITEFMTCIHTTEDPLTGVHGGK